MLNFYTFLIIILFSLSFIAFNVESLTLALLLFSNSFIICLGLKYSLKHKFITIDLIYWIFNFLFFFIAVIVQLNEAYFPNRFPTSTEIVATGQLFILIWNFTYLVTRRKKIIFNNVNSNNFKINKKVAYTYFFVSTFLVVYIFLKNGYQYFLGHGAIISGSNEAISVLVNSVVYSIVYANLVFQFSRRAKNNIVNKVLILIAFIELGYINSPFNTSRFYLGFIIIFFIWYFYRKLISSFLFSIILLFGIAVIFPFFNSFRFGYNSSIKFDWHSVVNQFNELHFDAFSNFLASIEYVEKQGILFGENIIGSFLFFIPRSFWGNKPEGSGTRIGNYLIDNYGLNFNNLSNPLISEFYLAFGLIGILVGAFAFAKLINQIEFMSNKNIFVEMLYGILLSYLIYLLRGSLIVAIASIVGTTLFIVIIPQVFIIKTKKKEEFNFKKINN